MQRSMNLRGFFLLLGLILLVFLILNSVLQGRVAETTEREAALREALSRLEEDQRNLNAQLSVVGTRDYIVSSAMENYAYMNRDDIRFQYANPEALYAYSEDEIRILMDEMTE